MATTSKMGIPYPASTDFVKDGATDMQSLAEEVDVRSGLVKIIPSGATNGTVAANGDVTVGSAVTSVVINGVFSANYDAYRVIWSGGTATANAEVRFQFGPSSVTGYNTSYYTAFFYSSYAGSGITTLNANNTSSLYRAGTTEANGNSVLLDINNAHLAKNTYFQMGAFSGTANAHFATGLHQQQQSYTDFTLLIASGNATGGIIRVYGYN